MSFSVLQLFYSIIISLPYLLRRRGEGGDEFGHDRFHLGVVFVQMFGQRAHEDDHTLANRVIAGVLRGVLQELLKHGQQRAHVVLVTKLV